MRLKLFLLFLVFVLMVGNVVGVTNEGGVVGGGASIEQQPRGFIIKLKEKPLLERRNELVMQRSAILGINLDASVAAGLNSQVQTIALEHVNFRQKAAGVLGRQIASGSAVTNTVRGSSSQSLRVLGEYSKVFNGIALDITAEEAQRLKSLPEVAEVYPNLEVKVLLSESIPLIGANQVWLLDRDGNSCAVSGKECLTGKGVKIAIIDTGVDYTHPDLGGCLGVNCKVVGGYDFINNDNDPKDDHGHGTHVTATAAGNGVLKGVAPDAKIYAYKVLSAYGSGSFAGVIAGIERAVDPNNDGNFADHVDVISMSLGGFGNPDDPQSQAVDNAVNNGVVVVVAAGNSGSREKTIMSPGTARKAITVGATTKQDSVAWFSSRGPVEWERGIIIKPDVVAPGVSICAAEFDGWLSTRRCIDDKHISISGTSMATPHVAGAAALLKQKNPDWTPEEIEFALKTTGKDLGLDINTQGYGRIRVLDAIRLDNPPMVANLLTSGVLGVANVEIRGTVKGRVEIFDHYEVYYQKINTARWNLICRGDLQIEEGALCPGANLWNILLDGDYYLKLVVFGKNGKMSEDRTIVKVDTISIKSPLNNDIFRLRDVIEFRGTVQGNFTNYVVEFRKFGSSSSWSNGGITLRNEGRSPVVDDWFAKWDTSQIVESGFYDIRLVVNYVDGRKVEELVNGIFLDPALKRGWPQRVDWYFQSGGFEETLKTRAEKYVLPLAKLDTSSDSASVKVFTKDRFSEVLQILSGNASVQGGFYYWAGNLEPVVYDLDNDGKKEVIVYKGGNPPQLLVYNYDGSLKWSSDIGISDVAGGNLHIPLVGDIDNDGFGEILVFDRIDSSRVSSRLVVFNHDGSSLWNALVPLDFHPTLLMADLDFDGKKEVVIQGNDWFPRKMAVINNDGTVRAAWDLPSTNWGSTLVSSPAVGNFDDDPGLEIVFTSPLDTNFEPDNKGVVYVYNLDGSVVSGWPVYTDGVAFSSPAIGDINKDGKQDIVIGLLFSGRAPDQRWGGVYVFDRNGRVLPGWPVEKGWNFWSSPSLGDYNNDGYLEVGASRLGFVTYLINYDGSIVSGWPQGTSWNDYYSSIKGDVNGDGQIDLLTTAGGIFSCPGNCGGVYGWSSNGIPIQGFPKVTEVDAQAPVVIDDLDGDGKVDIIASSDWDYDLKIGRYKHRGSLYVWELPYAYNKDKMPWPTFMHDPQHTGCYDCNVIPVNSDLIGGTLLLTPGKVLPGQGFRATIPIMISPRQSGNFYFGEIQTILLRRDVVMGTARWTTVAECRKRVTMQNGVLYNNQCDFKGQNKGVYQLLANIDVGNVVKETNEGNNKVVGIFPIGSLLTPQPPPIIGKAVEFLLRPFRVG